MIKIHVMNFGTQFPPQITQAKKMLPIKKDPPAKRVQVVDLVDKQIFEKFRTSKLFGGGPSGKV